MGPFLSLYKAAHRRSMKDLGALVKRPSDHVTLILSVDAYNEWTIDSYTDPVQLEMSLYYDVAGVRVPLVTGVFNMTGEYQTYTFTVNVDDVSEAIGAQLSVELNNVAPEFTVGSFWTTSRLKRNSN